MKNAFKPALCTLLALCTCLSTGSLLAKNRDSAGDKLDRAIDKTEKNAEKAKNDAKDTFKDAHDKVKEKAQDAADNL